MKRRNFACLLSLCFLPIGFSSCGTEKCSSYSLVCRYDDVSTSLQGNMDFTYYNDTGKEQNVLWFQLYPSAYRKDAKYSPISPIHQSAYYDGVSYGNISIDTVKNCRTYEIGGEDKNILFVTLNEPVKSGRQVQINVSFTTFLPKVEHRLGVTKTEVNLCNFYPVLCGYDRDKGFYECVYYSDGDPFYTASANYTMELTLPKGYSLACSGKVNKLEEQDAEKYTVQASSVRDIGCAFSKEYHTMEQTVGQTRVQYYYNKDENAEKSLKVACEALEFFSETFGEYEWQTYTVAESGFCFGGMEYPSFVLISDEIEGGSRIETIVHETAHQWWYAMVGNNQCEYAWMDEGLADYATALFFESHEEYGRKKEEIFNATRNSFHSFCSIYRQMFGEVDVTMNRDLSSFVSEYEYVNIAYGKGSLLFSCLEDAIGSERVVASLKKYKNKYCDKIATPEDLVDCFPMSAKSIFASFFDGTAII